MEIEELDKPPQRIPFETKRALFCYCVKRTNDAGGWTVDPTTQRAVCYACGKPSPLVGIRECYECGIEFVDFEQERFKVWPNGRVTLAICYCKNCA